MLDNSIIYLIFLLFFVTAEFIVNRILHHLNAKNSSATLPDELADIYDPETYAKQQRYKKANSHLGQISATLSFIYTFLMLALGGYAIFDFIAGYLQPSAEWVIDYPNLMLILYSLTFFAIIYVISTVIDIPFSYYDTFVIEENFGFNKTTRKTFWLDTVKSFFLSAILSGLLLAVVEAIYLAYSEWFWLLAFVVIAVFSIFMNMFYSSLIVPLFNKQTPLEQGELRDAIQDFARQVDFKLDNIYVMDSSKRSTKANAYFSGLGPKKRIVLFDTLIQQMTTREIVAVLAHEIGHYKHKHTKAMLAVSLANSLLMTSLLGLFLGNSDLAAALNGFIDCGGWFNIRDAEFHINLLAFGLLYTPISFFIGWAVNAFSRHNEYQADAFASEHGLGEDLISALKKLSKSTLSNLTPHPLFVSFNYSHPTLLQRIKAIRKNYKSE